MLLSASLLKLAKYLVALKIGTVANYLQKQIMDGTVILQREDGTVIQIPKQFTSMQQLPQDLRKQVQQKKRLITQDLINFVTQVNKILSQCNGKIINLDKKFVEYVYTTAKNCGMNIFNKFQMQNILKIVKQYKEYLQFLEKQEQDYLYFDSFQKMQQTIDKYKAKEQIQNKRLSKAQWVKSKGIYKICKYTKYADLHEIANGSGWCVDHMESMFNSYGAPYYLVLKNGQIHSLLNFNSLQNKKKNNSKVDDMDQQLADLEIQVMQQDYKGKTKVLFGGNFDCLIPFYSTQLLIDGFQHGAIPKQQIHSLLGKAIQNGDDKKFDQILNIINENNAKNTNTAKFDLRSLIDFISTQNQYQKIMLKIFPKTDNNLSDQDHLIYNVQLSKDNVVALMYNSFKKGKTGIPLFSRMVKFAQSQPNVYKQFERVNLLIVKQKDVNGKTLIDYVSFLNQLNILDKLGLKLDKEAYLNVIKNMGTKDQIDKPMLDYLKDKVDYDTTLLQTIMETRKPGIVEYFLKTDLDFSQKMNNQQTPIMYVIKNGYQTLFNLFKTFKKIVVSEQDNNPQFIYGIMRSKKLEIISYFLQNTQLDFNQVIYNNMTPLFYAVKQKLSDILDFFLKNDKIDKDIQVNGRNLMYWAIQSQQPNLAQKLCETEGADIINKIYNSGKLQNNTVLTYMIQTKNQSVIKVLLSNKDIDVNIQSPIQKAILFNDKTTFDGIINHKGFDIKYRDINGQNPLTFAINNYKNDLYYIQKLTSKYSNHSGLYNSYGYSPLMCAIEQNLPVQFIKTHFQNVSLNGGPGTQKNAYNIAQEKSKTGDKNMIDIFNWVYQKNQSLTNSPIKKNTKTKKNTKAVDIYVQLKNRIQNGDFKAFEQYLNDPTNAFDFSSNLNIIEYCMETSTRFKYLDSIFKYLESKNQLENALKAKNLVQLVPHPNAQQSLVKYLEGLYQKANIKLSSKNYRIKKFVESYLI